MKTSRKGKEERESKVVYKNIGGEVSLEGKGGECENGKAINGL